MSKNTNNWKIGDLVVLSFPTTFYTPGENVRPEELWATIKDYCKYYGKSSTSPTPRFLLPTAEEWRVSFHMKYIRENNVKNVDATFTIYPKGSAFILLEIMSTPWKKRWVYAGGGTKRQRFTYARLLGTNPQTNKPQECYLDISPFWDRPFERYAIFDPIF